jgi:predicted metalloendopeptidase
MKACYPTRIAVALACLLGLPAAVLAHDAAPGAYVQRAPAPSRLEVEDFGLPIGFSVEKMDRRADPRKDFQRYAAGHWLDVARIPADALRISPLDQMAQRVEIQVGNVLDKAARSSATAPKGSPLQQVGDLYAAAMDEKRLSELGVEPLKPEFDRIDALQDAGDVAAISARFGFLTDESLILAGGVLPDYQDRTRYAVYVADSELGLANPALYAAPEGARIRAAYEQSIADTLTIAGNSPEVARKTAAIVLAVETRIARLRQNPVEARDPAKRYVRMSYADLKAMTPTFDWDAYFRASGVALPREVIAMEAAAMRERDALLRELPLADQKAYMKWELLRRSTPYLSPEFDRPALALTRAIYGEAVVQPARNKIVAAQLTRKIGQPLSRLYVEEYFSPQAKRETEAMVALVRAQLRGRIERNAWLAPETRARALDKLDRMQIAVGYPAAWIDHSSVDVRPGDYFGSITRINEFKTRRNFAKLGQPVCEDTFSDPRATLPIIVNAAYDSGRNGIDIPAAFLQPPMYDPKADPAVNYCAMGAVIGHELTHGFDSSGRLYDAVGNASNWWTATDEKHFVAEAGKLVRHADAYEVLPGLRANGALAVGENLADVGGLNLGHDALRVHLAKHPHENRRIDGLTQDQRCFIAWGQVWASKENEGYLRQATATDPHPPGNYRALAPAQQVPAFYKAFGIRPGDPMWLAPSERVAIW